ncbi:MAG: glycosyltransferase [Candidatus Micrarchaeota archaeon]
MSPRFRITPQITRFEIPQAKVWGERQPSAKPQRGLLLPKKTDERIETQKRYLHELGNISFTDGRQSSIGLLYRLNGGKRGYLQELRQANESLPQMHPDCKLSVVIPAYREKENIQRALEDLTEKQKGANPKDFEVIVLVNRPNPTAEWDETAKKILQFKKTHSEYAIHVVEKTFNFPRQSTVVGGPGAPVSVSKGVRMGLVMKFASDLALLRNVQRLGNPSANEDAIANHAILISGADVAGRHPRFVEWLKKVIVNRQDVGFVRLNHGIPLETARKIPLFWAFNTYRQAFADAYHENNPRRHGMVRSSVYAKAGGFKHDQDLAEEIEFGGRVAQTGTKILQQGFVGVIDNPRRSVDTLLSGRPIVAEYSDFKPRPNARIPSVLPLNAILTQQNLEREINAHLNAYLGRMRPEEREKRAVGMLKKGLLSLGLQPGHYEIQKMRRGIKVKIRTCEPVRRAHAEYVRNASGTWQNAK